MPRELHDTVHELLMEKYEPIAIIGIGLRFPGGCESLGEFDEFLRGSRSGVRPIPEDRWDVAAFTPDGPEERGKIRTTSGGFLDRIDLFDAAFFNISPKEAQYIDPQQRMLMETAWQALENANIDPTPLRRGNGGVYIGAGSIDYAFEIDALPYTELDGHLASGITMFPLSGRLSYFLGWRGPSISVDTACSSSLVALHLAVQGLRRGECDIALCGGVNALHHPRAPVIFSHAQMLAPDGQCKTFDEAADGYARAEGCGVIVLKRLSVAQRDGDNILAVVLGTAVGQDGDSAGLTVPNGAAQEAVIRNALAAGRLTPGDIQYVEAHGTGTPLGDPIELGAINDVFAQSHTKDEPLLVGSVKTNLGHMEPASGLVGLIKVVSQLRSATIYPHLNLRTPSGRIPWATYPISVPTECRPWEAPVCRAVVNSFGFAGTIATVAVEQAPPTTELTERNTAPEPAVLTVSAKSDAALHDQLKQYQRFLADHPDVDVQRLCYSSNVGRSHFNRRVAAVVSDRKDLASVFDREIARTERPPAAGVRKVGFLFSGQGSQYPGMGAALYRRFPVFSERVDECDRLFAPVLGESVRALLLGEHADAGRIDQTVYTQPALFTLEYALAELWMSWGIRPSVLIGHSIGEVVAATVAGLFSAPDAVTLVAARARLMQSVTEPGGMAAVSAPAEEVVSLLSDHTDLALAAINAPNQCVISGGTDGLMKVVGTLRERAIRVDELSVSHAFHSPLMAEVLDEFRAAIAGISFREPAITLISNLTGKVARRADLANPEYWVRHIGEPVLFMDGMRAAARRGRHAFIEIGPSTALTALAKQCLPAEDHLWLASLRRRDQVGNATLRSLVELYTAGMPVSWTGVHANRRLAKLTLPFYPFQRKRYWLPINGAGKTTRGLVASGPVHHPLLGQEVPVAAGSPAGSREFITECSAAQLEYLADHVVSGSVMLPAAGYIEALLAAQDAVYGNTGRVIRDLVMHEPLLLAEDTVAELRMRLVPADEGDVDVELVSTLDGQERRHATATLAAAPAVPCDRLRALLLDEAATTEEVIGREDIYTDFDSVDRRYGERFRLLSEVRAYPGGVLRADLDCRAATAVEHLPVEVLDGAMQALSAVDRDGPVFSPTGVEAVRLFKKPRGRQLRLLATMRAGRSEVDETRVADLLLLEGEAPVVELTGVVLTRATESARHRHFMHRLSWLRQSATTQPTVRARHVVVVNGDRHRLPELAEQEDFDHIRVSTVDDVAALSTALADSSVTDVCWFWRPASGAASVDRLRSECEQNYRQLLDVVAVLDGAPPSRALRLWLITEGVQLLPGDQPDGGERLAASSLWGFGLALVIEYPRYRATLVDLPANGDPSALLAGWRVENADEFQVAYRDGQRYVRRVLAGDTTPAVADEFAVRAPASGDLADLVVVPADQDLPGLGQIQVRVRAVGMNFKDMLLATGALPVDADRPAPVLGFECSGTVVATGPGAEFAVGEEVLVHHPGTLRRTVTVPSAVAARKPSALDLTEAAALPAAYVTAFHALHQLADVKAGDRVLVHAAAGGVGQAAVALAKRAGAEVFATASQHKWPLLRDQGVAHLMNSRSTDFADEVLRQTGRRGVDVVLNSLGAGHAEASLRCLATGGRFVELGTTEVYTPDQLHQIRPDITYHAVDLAGLPQAEQLRLSGELLRSVVDLVDRAELPPLPVTSYSFDEISEAFGVLRRGANIGKVVVRLEAEQVSPARQTPTELTVRPDRTYLVTGGLGGLGVVTARKLVDLGARHVVLLSRRGTPTPEGSRVLNALSERAEVTVLSADIGSADDVARVFAHLGAGQHPLGGIVHAAGEIGKSLISSLTWDVIDQQLRSKMYGGWLLHEASRDLPDLDFFVVYSSIAAVTGGMTHQAHYAAANVFLDSLAIWRDRQGLPGLATNWGAWASVGMSAQLDDNFSREMERGGVRFFSPARGLRALGQLLSRPVAQRVVGEYDWDRVAAAASNVNALYSRLARPVEVLQSALDLKELLAKPKAERLAVVTEVVRGKVAAALHCDDAESVDTTAELVSLGLDSLMAMEVKSGLESAFRLALPASLAFDYPSVHQLTEFVNGQLAAELTS